VTLSERAWQPSRANASLERAVRDMRLQLRMLVAAAKPRPANLDEVERSVVK
jgi:hypothetical protein